MLLFQPLLAFSAIVFGAGIYDLAPIEVTAIDCGYYKLRRSDVCRYRYVVRVAFADQGIVVCVELIGGVVKISHSVDLVVFYT